jgi:hypothetical protein
MPIIDDFVEDGEGCLGSIILANLEDSVRHNKKLLAHMHGVAHFCTSKQKAHIMHKSHHVDAIRFVIEHCTHNKSGTLYKFFKNPSAKNPVRFQAMWNAPRQNKHVLYGLFDFIMEELQVSDRKQAMAWEYDLKVDTCTDCNMGMTMQFWYRYLLYGNNPERMLESKCLRVQRLDDNDAPVGPIEQFPNDRYSRTEDYFGAYIAFYLHSCLPHNLKKPAHMENNATFLHAKQVYLKCAWITLQTVCLICEYKKGAESSGKWNNHPKSLLGNIELYLSYFAWTLLNFKFPELQEKLGFMQWHQMYVWDLPNSVSFWKYKIELIGLEIIPVNIPTNVEDFISNVSNKMITVFKQHLYPLACIILEKNLSVFSRAETSHFIPLRDCPKVLRLAEHASPLRFNSMLRYIGIRALWQRVCRLSRDAPEEIRNTMKEFLMMYEQREINNMKKSGAQKEYMRLISRKQERNHPMFRGAWASVLDLWNNHALLASRKSNVNPIVV